MFAKKSGFVLLESIITCALLMLLWYFMMQCAVNTCMIEFQLQQKVKAFFLASTTLDKVKNGIYPLKSKTIVDGVYTIDIDCIASHFSDMVVSISIKISSHNIELLCIKTAVIKK